MNAYKLCFTYMGRLRIHVLVAKANDFDLYYLNHTQYQHFSRMTLLLPPAQL